MDRWLSGQRAGSGGTKHDKPSCLHAPCRLEARNRWTGKGNGCGVTGDEPDAQTARAAHRSISTKTLRAGLRACKSGVQNSGRPLLPGPESSGFKAQP